MTATIRGPVFFPFPCASAAQGALLTGVLLWSLLCTTRGAEHGKHTAEYEELARDRRHQGAKFPAAWQCAATDKNAATPVHTPSIVLPHRKGRGQHGSTIQVLSKSLFFRVFLAGRLPPTENRGAVSGLRLAGRIGSANCMSVIFTWTSTRYEYYAPCGVAE